MVWFGLSILEILMEGLKLLGLPNYLSFIVVLMVVCAFGECVKTIGFYGRKLGTL